MKIKLVCTPLRFYAQNDEDAFFEWLKKIRCIEKFEGIGRELHLYIPTKKISRDDLFELFGIFTRYNFDQSQLKVFMNEKNKDLFEDIQ